MILIIEDNKEIANVLALLLDIEGYRVANAESGRESIHKAREVKPHLILLDYMLPDMDGASVTTSLKRDKGLCDIPIIMMSASGFAKRAARKLPIDDFIEKPFDIDDLLRSVETHIEGKT